PLTCWSNDDTSHDSAFKGVHTMDIPTPPTDSLYKFKAISGIVLLLGLLYIGYLAMDVAFHLHPEKLDADARHLIANMYGWGGWLFATAILFAYGAMLIGFREWRLKIQEPQDELLQIQLEQARLALAKL